MLFSDILNKGITESDRQWWIKVMDRLHLLHDNANKPSPQKYHLRYECHSICLALKQILPELNLTHGCYLGVDITQTTGNFKCAIRNCRHSWLVTPDNAIIDPYPVGFLSPNPIIIGTSEFDCFGRTFYLEQPSVVSEINYKKVWRQAKAMSQLMH